MSMEVSEVGEAGGGASGDAKPPEERDLLPDPKVPDKEKDLTEAFKMFDLNGDGKISKDELGRVLRSLGETMSDADLEQMIRDVDTNGDGEIDLQEFIYLNADHNALRGHGASASSTSSASSACGSSAVGAIGAVGVVGAVAVGVSGSADHEALQSAFRVFDANNDGFISAGELHKVLSGLGDDPVSLEDCRYMISCVDLDGDQLVDFKEFQTLMSGNPAH